MKPETSQLETLKLLFVFAHPDDETFGTGGTIALYARRGVETHYICATRGEVGEAPPDLRGYKSIGEMREGELKCAAQVLGLRGVHFLNYRDSGMAGSADNSHPNALAAAPREKVAREVARLMREIRPQVVVTFDPIGGYRHPDHIAIHHATNAAFQMAGDVGLNLDGLPAYTPQKLYYSTFSRRFLRAAVRVLRLLGQDPRKFGKNKDIDIASLAEVEFPIHAAIQTREVSSIKLEAFACHSSQGGGAGPMRWLQRFFDGNETYMRAIPETPPAKMERDLFKGVVGG